MSTKPAAAGRSKAGKPQRLSRLHAPVQMAPEEWQRSLRRQFGREQEFLFDNLGSEPFFSDFGVTKPQTKSRYWVAIRGQQACDSRCSCPDFATNELGTCKHIEFVLSRLERRRGAKTAFKRGYQPPFSELYLRNDGGRWLHFRQGIDCPPALTKGGWPDLRCAGWKAAARTARRTGWLPGRRRPRAA